MKGITTNGCIAPIVEFNPPTARCEVCGLDTAPHTEGVYIIRNNDRPATGSETLAVLCIRCYAAGIKWAARQAFVRID